MGLLSHVWTRRPLTLGQRRRAADCDRVEITTRSNNRNNGRTRTATKPVLPLRHVAYQDPYRCEHHGQQSQRDQCVHFIQLRAIGARSLRSVGWILRRRLDELCALGSVLLRALCRGGRSASRTVQLALDGAQCFFEAINAPAMPSLE